MRDPHRVQADGVMHILIGFLIALAVGLTGIGGGSFTVPALVLIARISAETAVGTAFVFAGVLRLIAAPFYLAGRHIHGRYLWLLSLGAVPGLLLGTYILRLLSSNANSPVVVILLGVLLTASSSITFIPRAQNRNFAKKNSRWLPWLALPIGVEAGFSSAGAGALGTVLLLNYSEMTPPEVVGTDILFGLVLAVLGSAFHWRFGSINGRVLVQLLEGGIPGVIIGCASARYLPARKLKLVIALIAIFAGLQLVWSGSRALMSRRAHKATGAAKVSEPPTSFRTAEECLAG
ncbi:MAG TPA: sulfite exporter TauE/SafE family protein [Candidatus Acidoferrales bacterium]|nr:sulfite exporter TauE/SafE family protein [Candidatus Acidoferrales bacterium]